MNVELMKCDAFLIIYVLKHFMHIVHYKIVFFITVLDSRNRSYVQKDSECKIEIHTITTIGGTEHFLVPQLSGASCARWPYDRSLRQLLHAATVRLIQLPSGS